MLKTIDPEELRLRREQAQQQAAKMRTLYQEFFTALTYIMQYAERLEPVPATEELDGYQLRYKPLLDEANRVIGKLYPQIRVEPGADEVCDYYTSFFSTFNAYIRTLKAKRTKQSFWAKMFKTTSIYAVRSSLRAVQDAIRNHISDLDGTT